MNPIANTLRGYAGWKIDVCRVGNGRILDSELNDLPGAGISQFGWRNMMDSITVDRVISEPDAGII